MMLTPNEDKKLVEVCSECLRACCWHGEFMCDNAKHAGTRLIQVWELRIMNREHSDNWSDETLQHICGSVAPHGYAP